MSGTLFLVATPIGNLRDFSQRAIETLSEADLIAAEDTRNSIKLLNHFEIKTPMTSYHEFNKYDKAQQLIDFLHAGKNIALISDAGTPGISDPGEVLVKKCHEENIPVTSLPGCCACITALILSGLPTGRFCFEGFLPFEKKDRREILEELAAEKRTMILYEAPHRLKRTLADLLEALGDREIVLCRELTKKFEEIMPMTLTDAVDFYDENDPRGEYVLVVRGLTKQEIRESEQKKWEEMSLTEHMDVYLLQGMDKKEAMKKVAADRGISKREVYKELLEAETDEK